MDILNRSFIIILLLCSYCFGQDPISQADAEYKLGGEAYKSGNPQLALEHLLKAIELNPNKSQYLGSAGNMETELGLIADARKHYLLAMTLDIASSNGTHPKIPEYLFRLGGLELRENNYDSAISYLNLAIASDSKGLPKTLPRLISAKMLLALAWENKKDFSQAIEQYTSAINDIKSNGLADSPQVKPLLDKMNTALIRLENQ